MYIIAIWMTQTMVTYLYLAYHEQMSKFWTLGIQNYQKCIYFTTLSPNTKSKKYLVVFRNSLLFCDYACTLYNVYPNTQVQLFVCRNMYFVFYRTCIVNSKWTMNSFPNNKTVIPTKGTKHTRSYSE